MTSWIWVLLTLMGSPVLVEVVRLLAAWADRRAERSVALRCGGKAMTVTGLSRDEQQELVEQWLTGCEDEAPAWPGA